MKELSIEEKAKAYDKAIERARYWEKNPTVWSSDDICQKLFPELKESEDERIRKALLNDFKNNCSEYFCAGINRDMVIAWLEKQSHDGKKWIYEDVYIKEKEQLIQDGIDEVLENPQKYGLEKQAEQKSDPRYSIIAKLIEADDIYQMSVNDAMVEEAKNKAIEALSNLEISKLLGLEKQGEQKPTDKIEPKFKVGDWIIHNTSPDLIYYVESILSPQSDCYCLEHNGGTMLMNFSEDNDYHLWTIQDAKDGDVLATKDAVFIFKHIDKTGLSLCKSYCEVIGNSELGLGFDFSINGVTPAAKEQRDLLFAKMKESGYEWDAEKKELKKIEQKFAWSEEQIKEGLEEAASDWGIKASVSPISMIMDSGRPIGTQKHTISHQDSFKKGAEWVINKLKVLM